MREQYGPGQFDPGDAVYPLIIAFVILVAVVWGLVISPSFRVVACILVGIGVLTVLWSRDEAQKSEKAAVQAKAQEALAERERAENVKALWSKVSPSRVELRDPVFTDQRNYFGARYALSASVKNLSDVGLGGFEIQVTALDCVARSQCETVGHVTKTFWSDMIPPQEVRGIKGEIDLNDIPQVRGKLTWNLRVQRVFAGDALDEWLPGHSRD